MLAQRAAPEGPRWTRAVEDSLACYQEKPLGRAHSRLDWAALHNVRAQGLPPFIVVVYDLSAVAATALQVVLGNEWLAPRH